MQIKTQGFILKQRNIGENDRIITILTTDFGIIEASAKGVKSARSGISAACQILTYSEFCLFRSKSGYIVNSAEIVNSFYSLRLDVAKVALAGYFCELTTYLSPSAETASDFLKLLLNTLYFLNEDKKDFSLLKGIFELRGAVISGFMPNLVCCSECATYESELMYFIPLDGVLICADCMVGSHYSGDRIIKHEIHLPVLSALRHVVYSSAEKVFSFKLDGPSLRQFCSATENYILLHTEGKFRSLEVYQSLINI